MNSERTINVLSPHFNSPNTTAFLMPLIRFMPQLGRLGIKINFYYELQDKCVDCDALFIDSKFFKSQWIPKFDQTLETISKLNTKTKVVWCDQGDSTGTFLGQVLPHVHLYLKAQLLNDKREYLKEHYASRIWSEYYHTKFGIVDEEPFIRQPAQSEDQLDKLGLSWNSGLMNHGIWGPYIQRVREIIPSDFILKFACPLKNASSKRALDLSCRMGIPYSRQTMRYQREQIRAILGDRIPTNKLSRKEFFKELCNSKICISPFGLGEITLKDFECFLAGSLLLKPSMEHMQTWPNLFIKNETYLAHSWDLDDLESMIEAALQNSEKMTDIAQNAQNNYLKHTIGKDAGSIFATHFQRILENV